MMYEASSVSDLMLDIRFHVFTQLLAYEGIMDDLAICNGSGHGGFKTMVLYPHRI